MILIGVKRSPYTRRVAITLKAYGVRYGQRNLNGFGREDHLSIRTRARRDCAR